MKKMVLPGIVAIAVFVVGAGIFSRPYKFRGSVIDPPMLTPNFTLNDQDGRTFQMSDQRGRIVLLFFGYTSCPDVCPTTLAVFKQVRAQLSNQVEQVRFVFVTVDPERDTLERIKTYLGAFDPSFIGLSGSEAELTPVWRDYGVYRKKQLGSGATGYLMDHSARVYLVDAQGNLRLTFPFGVAADDVAQDVRYLLRNK
jgi:protein SCO1/2